MSQPHSITAASPAAVLDVVARAVLGEPAPTLVAGAAAPEPDVVGELVGAALTNARRLVVASRLWLDGEPLPARLARIMADAVTSGVASSAAVNVAGAMVGAASAGAEEELARSVVDARRVLTDGDLIAGAAALMLALSGEIARELALDPATAEFELRRADITA